MNATNTMYRRMWRFLWMRFDAFASRWIDPYLD